MGADASWLGPYLTIWGQYQGAVAGGRLAKALRPSHDLLGGDACALAFEQFAASKPGLRPEWFGPNCRVWLQRAHAARVPLVSPTGTLTDAGRRVYEGQG